MERISLVSGKNPIIFVAPHGANCDDVNTDVIAEQAAIAANAYAVINRGWERAEKVEYFKDKANCNNIQHCHEDVIKDEFLDPIIRFKNRIRKKHHSAYIFIIHGMGNEVRKKANDPDLSFIIGYGAGHPASLSCKSWMKDLFANLLNQWDMGKVYEGKAGGQYAGWARNNLNQLFRKWYYDNHVYSMQLEIVKELRRSNFNAIITGEQIAACTTEMLGYGGWDRPFDFHIKEF